MVRGLIACFIVTCSSSQIATAQPDQVSSDGLRRQVLDAAFSTGVKPASYFSIMTLRFDSSTQFTLTVYPGSKAEILRRRIVGMDAAGIRKVIANAAAKTPEASPSNIASRFKIDVTRAAVDYRSVLPLLKELETIRISPLIGSRVSVDEFSEYEFWYDTGQEAVHYSITGPFDSALHDSLSKWMIKFRTNAESWLNGNSSVKK